MRRDEVPEQTGAHTFDDGFALNPASELRPASSSTVRTSRPRLRRSVKEKVGAREVHRHRVS